MTPPALAFLDFDFSDDGEGHGSFEAMASALPAQLPALRDELARVLDWAHGNFGPPAALDEGGEWDVDLQGLRELPTLLRVRHTPGAGIDLQAAGSGAARVTLTVTLTGTAAFCAAFRAAFDSD